MRLSLKESGQKGLQAMMLKTMLILLSFLALFGCYRRLKVIYFTIAGKEYVEVIGKFTWVQGQESCIQRGGVSVAIEDHIENFKLSKAVWRSE